MKSQSSGPTLKGLTEASLGFRVLLFMMEKARMTFVLCF